MTTHVWGYLEEYEKEREDILDAVDTVFRSGNLIWGPSLVAFEEEFAGYHGVSHCAGVDNGTNAIVLGLRALGVGEGDEVITVSNTAAPTVLAITLAGATPVFVDIDPQTYNVDPAKVEEAITRKTRGIIAVSLYGQCADMESLLRVATEYALFLVDVEMPGMDGFDFVARTRADPALRDVPAILVTSRGSTGGGGDSQSRTGIATAMARRSSR